MSHILAARRLSNDAPLLNREKTLILLRSRKNAAFLLFDAALASGEPLERLIQRVREIETIIQAIERDAPIGVVRRLARRVGLESDIREAGE